MLYMPISIDNPSIMNQSPPRRPLTGRKNLLHVDAAVPILGAPVRLAVAQMAVERLVLSHELVGVKGQTPDVALPGLLLGEFHETAPEAGPLPARVDGNVLDEDGIKHRGE